MDASTAIAIGSRYVFLSDNVLVVSVKDGTPVVGTWAEDLEGLVMTERGRSSKVDVLELTEERFRIRVNTPKKPTDITLVPAITPPAPPPPVPTPRRLPRPRRPSSLRWGRRSGAAATPSAWRSRTTRRT